ncbi:MAG: DUF92 domain-containing protein [Gemmatimonadetes bacterium]|nr:DUF92 domain-containing protein [Gemmatimonadota bacterium]
MIQRVALGVLAAAGVALAARRAGSLSSSGALAATVVGTVAIAAGWGWGALLIGYFVASNALTRLGAAAKAARTGAIVEKGGARDAWQVMANGGLFALAALARIALGATWHGDIAALVGASALAAAASDTWSTEIGSWLGGAPRMITTGRRVPAGTSGGVTLWGFAGAALGALAVGAAAEPLVLAQADLDPNVWLFAAVAGFCGALVDSLLGALVQSRRRCPACDALTERRIHDCGTATVRAGGWAWMTNDSVNFLATLAAALLPVLMAWWAGPPC